jgi:hypothetical protein
LFDDEWEGGGEGKGTGAGREGVGICVDGTNTGREISRAVLHLDSIGYLVVVHIAQVRMGVKRLEMSGVWVRDEIV